MVARQQGLDGFVWMALCIRRAQLSVCLALHHVSKTYHVDAHVYGLLICCLRWMLHAPQGVESGLEMNSCDDR